MCTPVITHDLSEPSEMVQSTSGGFIYKTRQELLTAMKTLRNNPVLRNQLGDIGSQSVLDEFTEEEKTPAAPTTMNENEKGIQSEDFVKL